MSQSANLANLRSAIGIATGQDATYAIEVLSQVIVERRPAWEILVYADTTEWSEVYELPGHPDFFIEFSVSGEQCPYPNNHTPLDPWVDIKTDHVCYTHFAIIHSPRRAA